MKLPNCDQAIIDDEKLAGYCLNPNHTDGQDKPRVFKSALGLTIDDAHELKKALLFAVQTYDAIPDKKNAYGQKYVIDFPLIRENCPSGRSWSNPARSRNQIKNYSTVTDFAKLRG